MPLLKGMLGWIFWLVSPSTWAWHQHRVVLACTSSGWVVSCHLDDNHICRSLDHSMIRSTKKFIVFTVQNLFQSSKILKISFVDNQIFAALILKSCMQLKNGWFSSTLNFVFQTKHKVQSFRQVLSLFSFFQKQFENNRKFNSVYFGITISCIAQKLKELDQFFPFNSIYFILNKWFPMEKKTKK